MKTILFVDDDPNLLRGLKRGLHSSLRNQWQMIYADSGMQAIEIMASSSVDILVSDYRMPKMNGYELLHYVRLHYPEVIRIMLTGQPDRETYAESITLCHYFLWKPLVITSFTQLLERLQRLDDIVPDEKLKQLLNSLITLPTLPGTYRQLKALLDQPVADLDGIVNLIRDDAILTLQILKLVNFSANGLTRHINALEEAVQYLGINTLRTLVLAGHIFSCLHPPLIHEFQLDDLRQHSNCTARITEALIRTKHSDINLSAQAFLGGLLHDVGKLVLTHCLPETYRDIKKKQQDEDLTNVEAEMQVLGVSHAAVGAYLANLWGLPHPVVEAIYLHHQDHIEDIQDVSEIAKAVWHANRISHGEFDRSPEEVTILRSTPDFNQFKLVQEQYM